MYNEIDLMRLDAIVECSRCGSKKVKRIGLTTTIAAIHTWDSPEGRHEHDGNRIHASYECENGHHFMIQPLNSCWCGWRQSPSPQSWKRLDILAADNSSKKLLWATSETW